MNNICSNLKIDLSKLKLNKFIIYIPGISFNIGDIDWLAENFIENGYNFVRFNFKYHQSGNKIDDFNIENDLEDLSNLINYLENTYKSIEIGIIAKSFGAVKGFLYKNQKIKIYGFIGPAVFFGEKGNVEYIKNKKYGEINELSDIIINISLLKKWEIPTIIIHGNNDDVVNISNSKKNYNEINGIKKFINVKGMGHSYDNNFNEIISEKLINFFNKYF